MAQIKEIQRRIKSIKNTRKITKAMEMVAGSKMRKAVDAVLRTRTYANLSWMTVLNVSKSVGSGKFLHPLMDKRPTVKKVGIVLMTSNRGLCGSFNSAIIAKTISSIKKHQESDGQKKIDTEFIVVGKKGLSVYSRYGYKVVAEFPKVDIASEIKEVMPISKLIIEDYLNGKYDKVMVAYTDFISAINQLPRVKQLLPIDITAQDEYLGIMGKDTRVGADKDYFQQKEDVYLQDENKKRHFAFNYEPGSKQVLDAMLPRLIEIQLYQALLESNASEHSARVAAMQKASESAGDLVDQLTLFFNKARQAAITNEIAEISAGANSLNGK